VGGTGSLVESICMPTEAQKLARPVPEAKSSLPWLVLVAGWLVPGAGHFLLGKWVRGTLIFLAILCMYLLGLNLSGKIYVPNTGDILDILGFLGQIGLGMGYFLARLFGWGATSILFTLGDYGTKFLTVAGLLNIIAAVDAHSLANGRKVS
jgi:hypothetical protein